MSFFSNLFASSPAKKYEDQLAEIAQQELQLQGLSDAEILNKASGLKEHVQQSEDPEKTMRDILPVAFALVREASRRTLGQRHYDVQLMGGIALFEGQIAEMSTGEGKTLAATAPVFLRSLAGKGVHVVTVNDYLAQRDAVWMGQIYAALGMRTACIVHDGAFMYDSEWKLQGVQEQLADESRDEMGNFKIQKDFLRPVHRREAYRADIVYGTNHEFGFDYLRDNLAYSANDQVQSRPDPSRAEAAHAMQRVQNSSGEEHEAVAVQDHNGARHYFAVIDEVDSILIDEARTPLIISAPDAEAPDLYRMFAQIVRGLEKDTDYEVDEKAKFVQITQGGIEKVEGALSIDNLYDPQYVRLVHYLEESLKAKALFHRDRHYIVREGKVIIVDEFTGRLMPGRRFSGGLHQALEAKEAVKVEQESKTYAQITIQNYFRLYEKISGMTGTASTSSEEFHKVYGLAVEVIPSNKPKARIDHPDLVYKTKDAKYDAIVARIKECVAKGQPVLVGTTSIDENELLSSRFSAAGIAHEVLNAKNHEREAEIIAQAGRAGHVTLATNMAGRGVDIILGGNPPDALEAQKVREAGGLYVIGTQRNDARRIDNQLRGRAGRQGDPGETQFFLSLEDDMLRIFGGDRIKALMSNFNMPDDMPLESGLVVRVLNEAQKKVEGLNFDARKHLLEYDDVLNRQRKAIYRKRQNILEAINEGKAGEVLSDMVLHTLQRAARMQSSQLEVSEGDAEISREDQIIAELRKIKLLTENESFSSEDQARVEESILPDLISQKITKVLEDDRTKLRMLAAFDMFWTNHLENLEALLESVRMRAYGQKDPLVEYKRESFEMFKSLIANAEDWVVSHVFLDADAKQANIVMQQAKSISVEATSAATSGEAKVGRNDPCPCGSGKKYKKCHGA